MSCGPSCGCASASTSDEKEKIISNASNNNHDDFFSHHQEEGRDEDHHQEHDLNMERRTLNRLCTTARNRGKMDETQRLEVEVTRKSFCEGFAAGVDEGRLLIQRHLKQQKQTAAK